MSKNGVDEIFYTFVSGPQKRESKRFVITRLSSYCKGISAFTGRKSDATPISIK